MEPRALSASHGWTWITSGFRLFMKSPWIWLVQIALLFVCAKVLSFVPIVGVIFVLLIPVFIAGLMEGCRALDEGQELKTLHITCGFRRNAGALVTLGGISLVVNLVVVLIAFSLGGEAMSSLAKTLSQAQTITPQMTEQVRAETATVGRALLVATLISLPLLMALWYAPLLVYFHDAGPVAAMKSSFFACLKNTLPLFVYGLVIMGAMFLVMPISLALGQYGLALWLLAPIVLPSLYTSYKDIYMPTPAPASHTPASATSDPNREN